MLTPVIACIEAVYRFLWGDLVTLPLPGGGTLGLPLLVILVFAALPVGRKLYLRLPEKVQSVATPVLVLVSLVLCTASLVDASYNPFLYFRF